MDDECRDNLKPPNQPCHQAHQQTVSRRQHSKPSYTKKTLNASRLVSSVMAAHLVSPPTGRKSTSGARSFSARIVLTRDTVPTTISVDTAAVDIAANTDAVERGRF